MKTPWLVFLKTVHGPKESQLESQLQGAFKPAVGTLKCHCLPNCYRAPRFLFFPTFSLFPTTLHSISFLPHSAWQRGIFSCQQNSCSLSFWGKYVFVWVYCFQAIEYVGIEITGYTVLGTWSRLRTMSKISASPADAPHIQMLLNSWENPDKKHCKLKYQELVKTQEAGDRDGHFVNRMKCETTNYGVHRS